jgi:hypothetical protein
MPTRRRTRLIILAAGAFVLVAICDWAQNNELNVQFHEFQDSRGVSVLSPTAELAKDFTERSSLRVNYGVDAISAASDSCVRCHRNGVNNQHETGGLSITQKFDDLKLTLGGAYSKENFYRATTLLTSASRDLNKGNTTVAGGYTFSLNQPTLHPTQQIENQYQHNGFVSLTETLSKLTIIQAGYELGKIFGYQDDPFLRANVGGTMVVGHVPDTRLRQTVTARLRQALPLETYLQADYRRYSDDWQVRSNTINLGVSHHLTPTLLAGFDYRHYTQTGASFYQPEYSGALPQFFTADFRLEPFASNLYTGKLTITPKGTFLWLPPGSGLTAQYERYRADNGFESAIVSAGIRVPLGAK